MKKKQTIEDIERAFKLTHQAGIRTIASFMIGNIGETKETVRSSFRLMRKIKPYYCGFGITVPFPGTQLREELIRKKHLLDVPYDAYSSKKCYIRTDTLSPRDIEHLCVLTNLGTTILCSGSRIAFLKQLIRNPLKYLHRRLKQLYEIYSNPPSRQKT